MSRYRKVETATWGDARFRAYSVEARYLWLYLLTGPRTTIFPGLIVASEATIAHDLKWSIETLRGTFQAWFPEPSPDGSPNPVSADWEAGVIVLNRALLDRYGTPRESTRPENPNVLRGWGKSWSEIPECQLKLDYLRTLETMVETLGGTFPQTFRVTFAKPLGERYPKPSPNQEQEQEQDQDREDEDQPSHSLRLRAVPAGDPERQARGRLRASTWQELNRLRSSAAARFQINGVRALHPHDPGERELSHRILESGEHAEANCKHVLAIAGAEALASRSVKYLTGSLFGEKSWRRALGMTLADASRRSAAEEADAPTPIFATGDDE